MVDQQKIVFLNLPVGVHPAGLVLFPSSDVDPRRLSGCAGAAVVYLSGASLYFRRATCDSTTDLAA